MTEETNTDYVELATELTIAWLGNPNNRCTAEEVPAFLRNMHETVKELASGTDRQAGGEGANAEEQEHTPAVSVRKSLGSREHIISMIDGKPYRSLKRHLSGHGLTPAEYRQRYNLKPDYPMVAPAYSEARRDMAKKIGLGQKGRAAKSAATGGSEAAPAPKRRGRAKPQS